MKEVRRNTFSPIPDGVVTLELVDNKERNPNLDRQ
jgi:hypothetical protein